MFETNAILSHPHSIHKPSSHIDNTFYNASKNLKSFVSLPRLSLHRLYIDIVMFRSLRFCRVCFCGCIVFGCVFVPCLFTDIHGNLLVTVVTFKNETGMRTCRTVWPTRSACSTGTSNSPAIGPHHVHIRTQHCLCGFIKGS